MKIYIGLSWHIMRDEPELEKVFFNESQANKWVGLDPNRELWSQEVESPPIPTIPEGITDCKLLKKLNKIWEMRTEPIVQLIVELRNEYYELLCKADPKLKDYGNDFFTSGILDLINSQVFDRIGRD